MTKTALGVLVGILLAIIVIHIYRKWQAAKAKGQPFGLDDLIGSNNSVYSYEDGKCYATITNSITNNTRKVITDVKNCFTISGFLTAITNEYQNLKNQLSSIPNPSDPNDAINRQKWQQRINEIINILKTMKGCGANESFDVETMSCVKM